MILKLFTDLHIFGPLQIMTPQDLLLKIKDSDQTVLLGDIVDLKNCRKEDVGRAKDLILTLKGMCIYVTGNHELGFADLPTSSHLNKTFFSHSHLLSNFEKYSKWDLKYKEPGAGPFKRKVITPLVDKLRRFKEVRPNQELLENLKDLYDVERVYLGHSHPPQNIDFRVGEAMVTILTRGEHDVFLQ